MQTKRWSGARRTAANVAVVFVAATALDWATTLYTRHAAEQSMLAVVYSVLLTGLWWFAVRAAVQSPLMILPLLAAAVIGTWMGIRWL